MEDIRLIRPEQLQQFVLQQGESAFRAAQIMDWLWKKNVPDFASMNNIPKKLRQNLASHFTLQKITLDEEQKSADGCIKYLLGLFDGKAVEMVLIPSSERVTVCVSSQSGCALGCVFCATAAMGFHRNLFAFEMYEQIFVAHELALRNYGSKISNIVFMGMGEPLLNLDNVAATVQLLVGGRGMEISPGRITVSTAGICRRIEELAEANLRVKLALSLHSAIESKRRALMPVALTNPLSELSRSLQYFHAKTGERITVEYLLLDGINDQRQDAQALATFCKAFPVKINLISYNPIQGLHFRTSSRARTEDFVQTLESKNMLVQIRRSRGNDIAAACGQLAGKSKKESD
jgi:23S rRNA (adenine2503-C2)-methyltransferase